MTDLTSLAPPTSADRDSLILWIIGVLFTVLGLAVLKLWAIIREQREDCRKENEAAKQAAAAATAKTERLYEAAIAEITSRETRLVEVVERNTAAMTGNTAAVNALKEQVGSGYYRAVRDAREKADRDDGR